MKFSTRVLRFIASATEPLMRFLPSVGDQDPPLTENDYFHILAHINPLDLVLTVESSYKLTSWLISELDHVSVYMDRGWVQEAVPNVVRTRKLLDIVEKTQRLIILRPKWATVYQDISYQFYGAEYDYSFGILKIKKRIKRFYCASLAFTWLKRCTVGKFPLRMKKFFGFRYITPTDFYNDSTNFTVIYDSLKEVKS